MAIFCIIHACEYASDEKLTLTFISQREKEILPKHRLMTLIFLDF